MLLTIRQHAGAGLVAAAVVGAALAQGLFNASGYAAASIVIWAAVIAGLASRALPAGPVSRPAAAAGLLLAATAVLATVSLGWAADQGRAFEEAVRVSFYLGLFVLAVCTGTRAGRGEWIAGLTIGLGIVTLIALFAYFQPGLLDNDRSEIPNAAGRLSYPVGYWNGAGALLAAAAVLLAYAGARAVTRTWRALATALVPLAVLGIWLSDSRGAGLALIVGVAILIAASSERSRLLLSIAIGGLGGVTLILIGGELGDLTSSVTDSAMRADGDLMTGFCPLLAAATGAIAWRADGWQPRWHISRRIALALGVAALVAIVVGVTAADPGKRLDEFKRPPPTRAGTAVGGPDLSSNGRWQFWGQAIDAFSADPLRGVGAGGFEDWWAQHAPVALFVRNPHSLPLQQAAELGLPGLLLCLGFVAVLVVAAVGRLRSGVAGDAGLLIAVVAAGSVGAAVDWTWEIPVVFAPALVCSALLLASAPARPLARDGYWLGVGTVAGAWVAIVAGALVVLTHLELDQSRSAASADRIGDGIARASAAKTVLPWSSEPYTQLALLESDQGDLPKALDYLRQARDRDQDDWRLLMIEANLLNRTGDQPGARAAYERAQSLSPVPLTAVLSQQG